jgi:hypothetical protein
MPQGATLQKLRVGRLLGMSLIANEPDFGYPVAADEANDQPLAVNANKRALSTEPIDQIPIFPLSRLGWWSEHFYHASARLSNERSRLKEAVRHS